MVVDASVLLAVFFNEDNAGWCTDQMQTHAQDLRMSTVNLAEALIRIKDRLPQHFEKIRDEILASTIRFVPPTVNQSLLTSEARLSFKINLGDCFAYALAKEEGCPILTLDRDFCRTDADVVMP